MTNAPYQNNVSATGRKGRIQTAINDEGRAFVRICSSSNVWGEWKELASLSDIEGKYLPIDGSVPYGGSELHFNGSKEYGCIRMNALGQVILEGWVVGNDAESEFRPQLIFSGGYSPVEDKGLTSNTLRISTPDGETYKIYGEHNAKPTAIDLPLANGIANEGAFVSNCAEKLINERMVTFAITKASGSGVVTIATLPLSNRPKKQVIAPCIVKTSSGTYEPAICEIATTGVITVTAGSSVWTNAYAQVAFLTT